MRIEYVDPPSPGRPFNISGTWEYTRTTDQSSYTFQASDQRQNQHVANSRTVEAPDEYDRGDGEPLRVRAEFNRADGTPYAGSDLYVLGVLVSADGLSFLFELQDSGLVFDDQSGDGWYSGAAGSAMADGSPYGTVASQFEWGMGESGDWLLFVIAHETNRAEEGMTPHEAAQFIGGLPITDQLQIKFDENCLLVSDKIIRVK